MRRRAEGAIAESRDRFAAALVDGDAGRASSAYTTGARLLPPSADVVQGRAAIRAYWQAGIDSGLESVDLEPLALEGDERLAYEVGHYALRVRPVDGDSVVERGRYLLVHERQPDGSWRRAVELLDPDGS